MGKPFAGQAGGGFGGFGQGQQGGGFGNLAGSFQNFMGQRAGPQQSRMMGAPQPQMSPQPMGGGMGAFQDFMRQMQPQGGGFGQRPQPQMAGAPPQNLGGFGQRPPPQAGQAQGNLPEYARPYFENLVQRAQQQQPQNPGGFGGLSQLAGAPQQQNPDQGYADFLRQRDYTTERLGQYSNILRDLPPAAASQLGGAQQSQMSPQQMQSIMSAFAARQPQQAPQEMGVVDNRLGQNFGRPMVQQAPQFGGPQQSQMTGAPQQSQAMDAALQDFIQQRQVGQQPAYGGFGSGIGINIAQPPQGAPQPSVSLSPQQLQSMMGAMRFSDGGAVAEDPRMQAMRSIQQLANRQRGY
jgi:hypothetical protein